MHVGPGIGYLRSVTHGLRRNHYRIVLTGGPGGGKTTAADLFRREIGDKIVIVPETATMLFMGGFPRGGEPRARAGPMVLRRGRFHADLMTSTPVARVPLPPRPHKGPSPCAQLSLAAHRHNSASY